MSCSASVTSTALIKARSLTADQTDKNFGESGRQFGEIYTLVPIGVRLKRRIALRQNWAESTHVIFRPELIREWKDLNLPANVLPVLTR